MYPDPYNSLSDSDYWGGADPAPCRVCGGINGCVDAQPVNLTYPPVDIPEQPDEDRNDGPLNRYNVTVYGYTTVMRLNDRDAAIYGDAAELIT